MANVGTAAAGKTLIGAGNGSSPTYADIGTNSGLAAHGVVLAEGNSPFVVASPALTGTILMSNGPGSNPSFQNGGASVGNTITGNSGGALPPSAGNWNILGATVAAGTSPLVTAGAGSTITINAQISQALAAADATKIGLSNFNSTQFTVDANGFVSASGAVAIQFTTDSGTATPAVGNINILGGPGVVTSGSGSTITINAVQFTDRATSVTMTNDTGAFVTAAGVTLTTPASPTQGVELYIVATTADAVIVDAASTHLIRIGSLVSSAGGTATSTSVGDVLVARWHNASSTWIATSVTGTWLLA